MDNRTDFFETIMIILCIANQKDNPIHKFEVCTLDYELNKGLHSITNGAEVIVFDSKTETVLKHDSLLNKDCNTYDYIKLILNSSVIAYSNEPI